MLKFLSGVLLSSLIAVSSVVYLAHVVTPAVEDYSQLRAAARSMEGIAETPFGPMKASCSAVTIAPDLHLTAAHCDLPGLTVEGVKAVIVKKDEAHDLMLVYADLADDSYVPVALVPNALQVTTVGFPLGAFIGYVETITSGVIQGNIKGYIEYGTQKFDGWLLMTLPITGGNSGGGIFTKVDGQWVVYTVVSMGAEHLAISPTNKAVVEFLK